MEVFTLVSVGNETDTVLAVYPSLAELEADVAYGYNGDGTWHYEEMGYYTSTMGKFIDHARSYTPVEFVHKAVE